MIARVWKGAVRKEDSDAYSEYMQETGVAGYAKTPGNRGVWMLRRDVGERTEFMMFTLSDSLAPSKPSPATSTRAPSFIPRTSGSSSSAISPRPTIRSTPTSSPLTPDHRMSRRGDLPAGLTRRGSRTIDAHDVELNFVKILETPLGPAGAPPRVSCFRQNATSEAYASRPKA
jgi:hypothetical protein